MTFKWYNFGLASYWMKTRFFRKRQVIWKKLTCLLHISLSNLQLKGTNSAGMIYCLDFQPSAALKRDCLPVRGARKGAGCKYAGKCNDRLHPRYVRFH